MAGLPSLWLHLTALSRSGSRFPAVFLHPRDELLRELIRSTITPPERISRTISDNYFSIPCVLCQTLIVVAPALSMPRVIWTFFSLTFARGDKHKCQKDIRFSAPGGPTIKVVKGFPL
ncbi:Uncharacterized protein HZ326_0060 [Fusarium oxysporum f. sp. albedinis]|nr:Uncharacterized protein HZ326_0060 [Fusarium oxysporum f. sp. albedinis]